MRDFSIKKALTLRASSIGDTLMGKYFLENIHAAFPAAKLTLLVGSRASMIRELFAAYPWLTIVEVNRHHPANVVAAWREFQAGAVSVTPGGDTDWQAAFSGANGLKRLAQWIEATSFVDGRGRAYPPQNMHDRMAWLGELWPPAGTEIDVILSQHIASAFDTAQPVEHPKAEPSSDPDPAESTQPPTDE